MATEHETLAELVDLSADELYSRLAAEGFKGATREDLKRRGREIYENLRSRLRGPICGSERVRSAAIGSGHDRIVLAATLVDAISGYLTGVAAATFAVLLAKEGVTQLCNTVWQEKRSD